MLSLCGIINRIISVNLLNFVELKRGHFNEWAVELVDTEKQLCSPNWRKKWK